MTTFSDFAEVRRNVQESLLRRGYLCGESPVEDVDPFVIEQALRWCGEVGEYAQRLAKDGGKDRQRERDEWCDGMIVGFAIAALRGYTVADILAKLESDEERGYRHQETKG